MYKLLLVEDDLNLLEVTFDQIASCRPDIKITMATSGNDAIDLFSRGEEFDFIVSDYNMPNGNGLKFLEYLINSDYQRFFVFYSSQVSPKTPEKVGNFFLGTIDKAEFSKLLDCIAYHLKSSTEKI